MNVGDPELHKLKVENMCANLCVAQETNCQAFFINKTETGSCHLVNENIDDTRNRSIGYGWRRPDVSTTYRDRYGA